MRTIVKLCGGGLKIESKNVCCKSGLTICEACDKRGFPNVMMSAIAKYLFWCIIWIDQLDHSKRLVLFVQRFQKYAYTRFIKLFIKTNQ
jgi:hypothetical protein